MISSTLEGMLSSSNSYSVRLPYFRVGIGISTCTSFKCWKMPVDLESVSLDKIKFESCSQDMGCEVS
jgi:hypothetical protein